MSTYNPLDAMKRLEAAGVPRPHAEAIAAEIRASKRCRATEVSAKQLPSALDRVTFRASLFAAAAVLLACAILGVAIFW